MPIPLIPIGLALLGLAGGAALFSKELRSDQPDDDDPPPSGGPGPGPAPDDSDPTLLAEPAPLPVASPQPPDVLGHYIPRWMKMFGPESRKAAPVADALPEVHPVRHLVSPSSVTLLTLVAVIALVALNTGMHLWQLDLLVDMMLGALIGIGTNFIAIKMLFRPKNRILGFQGVIPANRAFLIEQMSQGIAKNLLNAETIEKAVHDSNLVREAVDEFISNLRRAVNSPEMRGDVAEIFRSYTRAFFGNPAFQKQVLDVVATVATQLPRELKVPFSGWVSRYAATKIAEYKDDILSFAERGIDDYIAGNSDRINDFLLALPDNVEKRRAQIESEISRAAAERIGKMNVANIVRERLETFDEQQLENLILAATDSHLAAVQYFGWALGFIAGPLPRLIGYLAG